MQRWFISLLLCLLTATAFAQPRATWYRYYDENHRPTITQSITEAHLRYGYEALDRNLAVIERVPAEQERARLNVERQKQQQQHEQRRQDQKLLELYGSVADAERARDRQLDAIQLRIDALMTKQNRLRTLRAEEAEKAAGFERQGRAVPAEVSKNVAEHTRQLQAVGQDIRLQRQEQDKVRADFAPVIERLRALPGARSGG